MTALTQTHMHVIPTIVSGPWIFPPNDLHLALKCFLHHEHSTTSRLYLQNSFNLIENSLRKVLAFVCVDPLQSQRTLLLLLTWSNKARQQNEMVELATPLYLPPVSLRLAF